MSPNKWVVYTIYTESLKKYRSHVLHSQRKKGHWLYLTQYIKSVDNVLLTMSVIVFCSSRSSLCNHHKHKNKLVESSDYIPHFLIKTAQGCDSTLHTHPPWSSHPHTPSPSSQKSSWVPLVLQLHAVHSGKFLKPKAQRSHFWAVNCSLHAHWPLSRSHCDELDPAALQLYGWETHR